MSKDYTNSVYPVFVDFQNGLLLRGKVSPAKGHEKKLILKIMAQTVSDLDILT